MCNVAFIIETGGRVGGVGLYFLDMLAGVLGLRTGGTQQLQRRLASERDSPAELARWRKRVALRGVALALTRQQGYVLEPVVDEIRAPDRAMKEVAGEYGVHGSGFSPSQPEDT
jgi:hypothetical protein